MHDDQKNAQEIFLRAIEFESSEERQEFLAQACAGDDALKEKINGLIESHQAVGSFLEKPIGQFEDKGPTDVWDAVQQVNDTRNAQDDDIELKKIGPFKLLQEIGEGGMGTVYMAQQEQPVKRRVALKVIKAGMDSKQVIARFEAERQALAMMDHPHIARLLAVGTTDSERPYFVMELVKGTPITDYCDQKQLNVVERLKLFSLVCNAVHHAHQKGIIHRDLKPNNILVAEYDEKVVPKIIDFGLAKALGQTLTEKTMFTQFGQVMGTLAYMSPEQSKVNALDIDTRADIYSLGVLLYELLTGSTPLDEQTLRDAALDQMLKFIREEVPPKPSTRLSSGGTDPQIGPNRNTDPAKLGRIVRGDLDWIVMKALEKERSRRYESASSFADDIGRYLGDEPVQARPPSTGYRVQKFVRKNRGLVTSVSAMVLLLLAGLAGTSWFAYQANQLAKDEKDQREIAQEKTRVAERKTREAEVSAKRSNDVLKIVTDSFRSANPDEGGTGNMTAKEVLFNAQKAMDTSDLDDEGRVTLLWALGVASGGAGELELAVANWEEVTSIYTEKLGTDHRRTLLAKTHLAASYNAVGQWKKALQIREDVLPLTREKLGADHPDTLLAMSNLAISYDLARRFDEARQLYETVIALYTEKLGPDHPTTLRVMKNLAVSHSMAGRNDESLRLSEKILPLRAAKLGPDHPETLSAMTTLANSYYDAGRLKEALELREKVLSLKTKKLGPDHPDTLRTITNLATSYQRAGQLKKALRLREKVLPLKTKKLGPDHPDTLLAMSNLVGSYLEAGHLREAIPLGEKVLRIKSEKLGEHHPETLMAMNHQAAIYKRGGRLEKALQLREKILPLATEKLGENHLVTLIVMSDLGDDYRHANRDDDALVLQEKVLPLMIKELGEGHPHTLTAMRNLAFNYGNNGREEEALELVKRVVDIAPNMLLNQISLAGMLSNMAEKEIASENLEVARDLLNRAIAIQKRVLKVAPKNETSRRFLGVHYDNLLKVGQGLDDPALISEAEKGLAKLESSAEAEVSENPNEPPADSPSKVESESPESPAQPQSNQPSNRYEKYVDALLSRYDANKDGELSQDEQKEMRRPPRNADANEDGQITRQELLDSLQRRSPDRAGTKEKK